MKRFLLASLLVLAIGQPLSAVAAPCAPAKSVNELLNRVNDGCSPITFDTSLTDLTLTIPSTLNLKNGVTLNGDARNITLAGSAALSAPLIKVSGSGVTIQNITLTHKGNFAVYFSGSSATDNTISKTAIVNSMWGINVTGGSRNTFTQNSFSGNTKAAIYLNAGNGNLPGPTTHSMQVADTETEWQVIGSGPLGGTVELYEADPNLPTVPQGKTYLASTSTGFDGTFTFTLPLTSHDPKKPYTLLATDSAGNTSTFAAIVVPNDDFAAVVDPDGDGVYKSTDNCPMVANADQAESDGDGLGDVCDNCAFVHTDDQDDFDADGIGDVCDTDLDGDGVKNNPPTDNCPLAMNFDQADSDQDGTGDACDVPNATADLDGDGLPDAQDNCVGVANPEQTDNDTDGRGDACDDDMDGDTVNNFDDNCPLASNVNQADGDADRIGDACELATGGLDDDADTVANALDNCPKGYNPDQNDADKDGLGDPCDADSDGDGAPNWADNCPTTANTDQSDLDKNKRGDACEEKTPGESPTPPTGELGSQGGCGLLGHTPKTTAPLLGMGLLALLVGNLLAVRTLRGRSARLTQ